MQGENGRQRGNQTGQDQTTAQVLMEYATLATRMKSILGPIPGLLLNPIGAVYGPGMIRAIASSFIASTVYAAINFYEVWFILPVLKLLFGPWAWARWMGIAVYSGGAGGATGAAGWAAFTATYSTLGITALALQGGWILAILWFYLVAPNSRYSIRAREIIYNVAIVYPAGPLRYVGRQMGLLEAGDTTDRGRMMAPGQVL